MNSEKDNSDRRQDERRHEDRRQGDRREEEKKKELLESIKFKAGDALLRQGDGARCAYIINSGKVELFRNHLKEDQQLIATLQKDDLLGEMSLISGEKHSVTAIVLEDCALTKITRENFEHMCKHRPMAMVIMLKTLIKRLRLTMDYVTFLEHQIRESGQK